MKINVVLVNSLLVQSQLVNLFTPNLVLLIIINKIFLGQNKIYFWDGLFGGHLDRCPFINNISSGRQNT